MSSKEVRAICTIFKDKRDTGAKFADPRWIASWWALYGIATAAGFFLSGVFSGSDGLVSRLAEGFSHVAAEWPVQFLVFTVVLAVWFGAAWRSRARHRESRRPGGEHSGVAAGAGGASRPEAARSHDATVPRRAGVRSAHSRH